MIGGDCYITAHTEGNALVRAMTDLISETALGSMIVGTLQRGVLTSIEWHALAQRLASAVAIMGALELALRAVMRLKATK